MRRSLSSNLSTMLIGIVCVAIATQSATAQARPASATAPIFRLGYTDIGPTLGLGGIGDANVSIGGRFEHAIKALPDMGNGMLGIQVGVGYYSWPDVSDIPIFATANYHFRLDDPKFDLFAGLGLGYNIYSCTTANPLINDFCRRYNSGVFPILRAGGRYFFSPSMAGYADIGVGGGALNIGLMFKLM